MPVYSPRLVQYAEIKGYLDHLARIGRDGATGDVLREPGDIRIQIEIGDVHPSLNTICNAIGVRIGAGIGEVQEALEDGLPIIAQDESGLTWRLGGCVACQGGGKPGNRVNILTTRDASRAGVAWPGRSSCWGIEDGVIRQPPGGGRGRVGIVINVSNSQGCVERIVVVIQRILGTSTPK